MPIYDSSNRRLVVRVVYDGPGTAGKTTNVQEICRRYPVNKRTEMYTPAALKGRTMFFDWLEVDLSTQGKTPIRAQLLSVTGQESRSYRRKPLIKSADAVVFVCDSRPDYLDYTRQRLQLLQRYLRERKPAVPYLIQANKQDLEGALPPEELVEQLRWRKEIPVLPAVASRGEGVAETFQQAARAAARYAQSVIAMRGIAGIVGRPETADGVLDNLLALEDQMEACPSGLVEEEPPPESEDDSEPVAATA
jgi:signal recognition particle receptor subunit beta